MFVVGILDKKSDIHLHMKPVITIYCRETYSELCETGPKIAHFLLLVFNISSSSSSSSIAKPLQHSHLRLLYSYTSMYEAYKHKNRVYIFSHLKLYS